MIRTQIYLTEKERKKIATLADELGTSQSELIRKAIDDFIEARSAQNTDRLALLQSAKGLWSERKDLPDFASLRAEFNRNNRSKE